MIVIAINLGQKLADSYVSNIKIFLFLKIKKSY